jgi:hypothetical protein
MPHSLAREWKSWDSDWRPWSIVMVCGQPKRDIHPSFRSLGCMPQCQLWCLGWGWLWPVGERSTAVMQYVCVSCWHRKESCEVYVDVKKMGCQQHKFTQWNNCMAETLECWQDWQTRAQVQQCFWYWSVSLDTWLLSHCVAVNVS